jgi:hypothetical protein
MKFSSPPPPVWLSTKYEQLHVDLIFVYYNESDLIVLIIRFGEELRRHF